MVKDKDKKKNMADEQESDSERADKKVFKCCKTKHSNNIVCVECGNIYHKSCFERDFPNTPRVKGDSRVKCCKQNSASQELTVDVGNALQLENQRLKDIIKQMEEQYTLLEDNNKLLKQNVELIGKNNKLLEEKVSIYEEQSKKQQINSSKNKSQQNINIGKDTVAQNSSNMNNKSENNERQIQELEEVQRRTMKKVIDLGNLEKDHLI